MMGSNAEAERAVGTARELMLEFAQRTGLSSGAEPRRYLWTDAFAVCNFLGLGRTTGESVYLTLAVRLIEQVHDVLGQYRGGGPKRGWLSGLGPADGAAHPTVAGLRIGKKLPERGPGEPVDEHLEWDRDGQYFHYLTKWMHALDQAARATGESRFNLWARELAVAAHRSFCYGPAGERRMVWKMSTDLTRPLVTSMGQHDAIDGLVTALQLQATARELDQASTLPVMTPLIEDFRAIVAGQALGTTDPLGLGGLLVDAGRVGQLAGREEAADGELLDLLLASALEGLPLYAQDCDPQEPAHRRLAFRELGLSIGFHALAYVTESLVRTGRMPARTRALVQALADYGPLAAGIESFWVDREHRRTATYIEHRDINDVMLSTSLAPEGFIRM